MILYTADWLLPIAAPPVRQGAVLVEDGRIAWVGAAAHAPTGDRIRVTALGRCVLMPGLVNAHSHLELTILRGCLEGLDFREWLRTLTAIRRDVLTPADLLDSSRLGIVEGLRHGITTYADATDSAAPLAALRELGVRGIGYVEVFGPDPAQRDDAMRTLRARVTDLRVHDTTLVRAGVSPHAPYTVSPTLFGAVADYAREESLPVAVHVAESAAEVAFVRDGRGPFADRLRARGIDVSPMAESPIALLERTGLLAAQPLLVHAIHVDDADLERVASHGASIVHCPVSNAKLGQGVAPLDRMRAHDIPTGLGSDSVASNNRMHLLEEARQAVLQHALRAGVPDSLTSHEALELATLGGSRALGLDGEIGTLEVGKAADIAAFPLPESLGPVYDPAVALVHARAGRAEATLVCVAGRELVRDGIVTGSDAAWQTRALATGQRIADALEQWRSGAPT